MPEPVTVTIIGATVVTVAVYAHKIAREMFNTPAVTVKQTGETTKALIKAIGSELRQTFNAEPIITINRVVIQQAPQRMCEWCLAKQVVEVEEKLEHRRFGSTKRLHISQRFTLKAGFDLNRVRLEFKEGDRHVRLIITNATIVNVEYHSPYAPKVEEHGWWNRISSTERDRVINSLPENAKEDAGKKELTKLAAEELKVVLGNFFKKFGCALEVECQNHNLLMKDGSSLPEIPEEKLNSLGIISESKNTW